MPKAAKGTKKIFCCGCGEEKLAALFTKGAKTCKDCNCKDRICGGCHQLKPATAYSKVWNQHCRTCNGNKDTAEHVDACETEGCDTAFSRDPDTFTWRQRASGIGNWNTKCKRCCAPGPKTEAIRCTGGCDELKPPEEFNHGTECKACRSERTRQERIRQGERVAKETAPKPNCCSRPGCGRLFSEAEWGYDEGGGRWKSWCKPCHNDGKYDIACRGRKLAKDPEGFRAHNAASLRMWRANNPNLQAQQQLRNKRNVKWIFNRWVRQAERRGLTVAMEQQEDIECMLLQPCFYCGYAPPDDRPLNTLDRVDNYAGEYNVDTSVTCCVPCNHIKGDRALDVFLDEARQAASSGERSHVSRSTIDDEYRSLSHPDEARRATVLHRHEHLCFVAKHNE